MIENSIIQNFLNHSKKHYIPIHITIELSQKCNFSCRHCYNFDRTVNSNPNFSDELSRKEVLDVIEQVSNAGALLITFTGGEPLLDPNLFSYIKMVRELRKIPAVKTNASKLTKEMAQKLKKGGVHNIEVSMYGATDATYKHFTGRKDSFSDTINGLKNAKEAGLEVKVNIILHRNSVDELSQMIRIVESFGWTFQISLEMTKRNDGSETRDFSLTYKQIKELMSGPHSDYFTSCNPEGGLQCPCATNKCAISSKGDILPCIGAPIKSGSVRTDSFQNIWKNSKELNKIRLYKDSDFKDCIICNIKQFCQRSSGSIFLNTGKFLGKDETICKVTRARKEVVGSLGFQN